MAYVGRTAIEIERGNPVEVFATPRVGGEPLWEAINLLVQTRQFGEMLQG